MKSSRYLQGPPLIIIPFVILAKKYGAWKLFKAAENYGFHNFYRRILEGIKILKIPESQAANLKIGIKNAFRIPSSLNELLNNQQYKEFIDKYCRLVLKNNNMPPFLISLAKLVTENSHIFDSFGFKWFIKKYFQR